MKKHLSSLAASLSFMIASLIMTGGTALAAGNATFSLSSSGNYTVNSTLSVTVNENSGSEEINSIEANLSYDADKLQFNSIDATGSGFNFEAVASGGAGSVSLARGVSSNGTVSGAKKVATVNFTVLKTGSAALSFKSSSLIVRYSDQEDIWNGVTAGGTYTLTDAPAAPPASNTTNAPKTPANTNPNTNAKAASAQAPAAQTPAALPPLADDQPVPTTTDVSTVGYIVSVQLFDAKGKVLSGINVKLDNKSQKSDATGTASFTDISPGTHTVTAGKTTQSIEVKPGDKTEVQTFTLRTNRPFSVNGKLVGVFGAILLLLALAAIIRTMAHRARVAAASGKTYVSPYPTPPAAPQSTSQTEQQDPTIIKPDDTSSSGPTAV